ncbi:Mdm10 protein [Martiniozyma asiatica (nom. inval.)]|nr:Mdm10 protein [Martiniozyma asiatica]
MDYVQRCFYQATLWDGDNSFEHILRTPRQLLEFKTTNGVTICTNNKNTEYSYSSVQLNQLDRLHGSLSYMFSSTTLEPYYKSSQNVKLQEMLQQYRDILIPINVGYKRYQNAKPYLIYGKMYFPSQLMEGMIIKRFTDNCQLIVKFVNTPKLNKLTNPRSIFTFYLQHQNENRCHDFIYSTHEALFGYRFLYNLNFSSPKGMGTKSLDIEIPSRFSIGCEFWYAANSMSPGLSFAARYVTYMLSAEKYKPLSNEYTRMYKIIKEAQNSRRNYDIHHLNESFSTQMENNKNSSIYNSGLNEISGQYGLNPLTFTFAANPLLGAFESTYSISSPVGISLSSKYSFNVYSFASDLTLGVHILRSKIILDKFKKPLTEHQETLQSKEPVQATGELIKSKIIQHPIVQAASGYINERYLPVGTLEMPAAAPTSTDQDTAKASATTTTTTTATHIEEEFISSFKLAGSVSQKRAVVAWEGKFKDWLVSSGMTLQFTSNVPKVHGWGIEFQYTV